MLKFIKNHFFEIFTYIFLIVWIYGAWSLVYSDLSIWDICPELLWVPACFIILFFFVLLFLIQILNVNKKIFYVIISIPLAIALYATIFQIIWSVECPKTEGWIPMCYISLFLFTWLLVSKIWSIKKLWNTWIITCPLCWHKENENIPSNECMYFYECKSCKEIIKSKKWDCCVFCSYWDIECIPKQKEKN